MQLDLTNLLSILDRFNLDEMINMADVNPTLRGIIRHHYMISKYHINELAVRFDSFHAERIVGNTLLLGNVPTILSFIRVFGDLISELVYNNKAGTFPADDFEKINRNIEQYCSKTLTKLWLIDAKPHLISKSEISFEKVVDLHITRSSNADNFEIDRIYPNIEHLHLTLGVYLNSLQSIVRLYPHLTHLRLDVTHNIEAGMAMHNLLQLNSQLGSLSLLGFPSIDLLQSIDEILPQLNTLTTAFSTDLVLNSPHKIKVHYRNLKSIVIYIDLSPYESDEIPFTFGQLESMEVTLKYPLSVSVQSFIQRNRQLKKLSFPMISGRDFHAVLATIKGLPNLKEITIQRPTEFSLNDLLQQIGDNSNTLQRITFVGYETEDYSDRTSTNWTLADISSHRRHIPFVHFIFVRQLDK